jgi:asparagine synthase (glutamine-hydrolysing)
MYKINLQYDKGFKWNNSENIHSKGFIFDKENNLYQGKDLNSYFSCRTDKDFIDKIASANGSFAIVIKNHNKLWIGVDRLRSIPLFYTLQNSILYISDSAYWIKDKLGLQELDKISEQEFLLTGYVTEKNTLFSDIKQVQAGEYLIVAQRNRNIITKINRYYRYLHKDFFNKSKEELLIKLDVISKNFTERLIKSANGRVIVIPLSGGYDSRYIAAMLKKFNYENVICFSYGKKGNWESEISKKVADKLGYEWHFIEYTKIKWKEWFDSKEMKEYLKYGNNLTSLAHLQDWLAVWELKKYNRIPNDSVFVPGHTGDFISGGHIPGKYINRKKIEQNEIIKDIFRKHYNLWNWSSKYNKLAPIFKKKIISISENFYGKLPEEAANIFEYWEWQNRQAKFIVNSVRVYEIFGYEWRIPLWDSELMDFWSRVPLKYRIKKELYDDYLFKNIFKQYSILFNNKNKQKKEINNLRKIKSLVKKN